MCEVTTNVWTPCSNLCFYLFVEVVSGLLVLDYTIVFVELSCCCYSSYNNFASL